MNQILANIKNDENLQNIHINSLFPKQKKIFKYIFVFSICIILLLFLYYIHYLYLLNQNKKISKQILYNYRTIKLYGNLGTVRFFE